MAKKKQYLTCGQVNKNLSKLFPDDQWISCVRVIENWNSTPTFYFVTERQELALIGKQVWLRPSIKQWSDYFIYCKDGAAAYKKERTLLGTMIPFIYAKQRRAPWDKRETQKDQADKILIACGIKREPKPKDDPISRLRIIGGAFYVEAYKIFSSVSVRKAHLRENNFIEVYTETGFYRFQVAAADASTEGTDEIVGIFSRLLNISAKTEAQPETAEKAA